MSHLEKYVTDKRNRYVTDKRNRLFENLWNISVNNRRQKQFGSGNLVKPNCDLTPLTTRDEIVEQFGQNDIRGRDISHFIFNRIGKGTYNNVAIGECEQTAPPENAGKKTQIVFRLTNAPIKDDQLEHEINDSVKEMAVQARLSMDNLAPKIYMVGTILMGFASQNNRDPRTIGTYIFSFQELKRGVSAKDLFVGDRMNRVMDMYDAVGKKGILNIDVKVGNILTDVVNPFERFYITDLDDKFTFDNPYGERLLMDSIEDAEKIQKVDRNTIRGNIMKYLFLMEEYIFSYQGKPNEFPYESILRSLATKELFAVIMCIIRNDYAVFVQEHNGKPVNVRNDHFSEKAKKMILIIDAYHYDGNSTGKKTMECKNRIRMARANGNTAELIKLNRELHYLKSSTIKMEYMLNERLMIPPGWLTYGKEYSQISSLYKLKKLLDNYFQSEPSMPSSASPLAPSLAPPLVPPPPPFTPLLAPPPLFKEPESDIAHLPLAQALSSKMKELSILPPKYKPVIKKRLIEKVPEDPTSVSEKRKYEDMSIFDTIREINSSFNNKKSRTSKGGRRKNKKCTYKARKGGV